VGRGGEDARVVGAEGEGALVAGEGLAAQLVAGGALTLRGEARAERVGEPFEEGDPVARAALVVGLPRDGGRGEARDRVDGLRERRGGRRERGAEREEEGARGAHDGGAP
jgi:hypothetical protein